MAATVRIICDNINSSMLEAVLFEKDVMITARQALEEFFEHFSVRETPDEISLLQANLILPTATQWWRIMDLLEDSFKDDPELFLWEELYHTGRLDVFQKLRGAGLHFV